MVETTADAVRSAQVCDEHNERDRRDEHVKHNKLYERQIAILRDDENSVMISYSYMDLLHVREKSRRPTLNHIRYRRHCRVN